LGDEIGIFDVLTAEPELVLVEVDVEVDVEIVVALVVKETAEEGISVPLS
jgi:hypothetical protein